MNVSKNTIDACYQLIGQCFANNRKLDRLVSIMGVEFAMNQTAGLLHSHIAHLFPVISDMIGEKCLEAYNIPVEYTSTPDGKENYSSVAEMIDVVMEMTIDFQNMLGGAMIIAQENQDMQVYVELSEILREFNPVVEQAILLKDKVSLYGDALYSFDAHIAEKFWILKD